MTRAALLRSWLVTPPLARHWIIVWAGVALPVAALLDRMMDCPDVLGECCTPFFIFILFTALLFGWSAGIVSVFGSMAASLWTDAVRPMHMDVGGSLISQQATFLLIGAAIVLSVELIRRMIVHFSRLDTQGETSSGVIFSLEQGQAWASWPGHPLPVRLGPQREVETMMEDFLAQSQVAQRLALSGSAKLPLG